MLTPCCTINIKVLHHHKCVLCQLKMSSKCSLFSEKNEAWKLLIFNITLKKQPTSHSMAGRIAFNCGLHYDHVACVIMALAMVPLLVTGSISGSTGHILYYGESSILSSLCCTTLFLVPSHIFKCYIGSWR